MCFTLQTLFGTYICTDIPGEFQWQSGALTQAVSQGRWLIIENINHASFEVISALIPLLESNTLLIPGRNQIIHAHPCFQFIATQSTSHSTSHKNHMEIITNHCTVIHMQTLLDFKSIFYHRYPQLIQYFDHISQIYKLFVHDGKQHTIDVNGVRISASQLYGNRVLNIRDFIKFCSRLSLNKIFTEYDGTFISSTHGERLFYEAYDCFVSLIAGADDRLLLAQFIGHLFNVNQTRVEMILDSRIPQISIDGQCIKFMYNRNECPRIQLPIMMSNNYASKRSKYVMTRHSLCLMEQISVCVTNNEPVLLVGETGNGKTAVIQFLARKTHQKLVVQNLSQATDSTDFLGGYKPLDLRSIALPIMNEFGSLYPMTFSVNIEPQVHDQILRKMKQNFQKQEWKKLIQNLKIVIKALLIFCEKQRMNLELKQKQIVCGSKRKRSPQSLTLELQSFSKKRRKLRFAAKEMIFHGIKNNEEFEIEKLLKLENKWKKLFHKIHNFERSIIQVLFYIIFYIFHILFCRLKIHLHFLLFVELLSAQLRMVIGYYWMKLI